MSRFAFDACSFALILGSTGWAQVTQRVSISSSGAQSNGGSGPSSLSADGRYVAFASSASNLVAGDTNGYSDVFVRDRLSGTTERVSVGSGGAQANGPSTYAQISADGRYVLFTSNASNLVDGDTNGCADVFIRDRQLGTSERASVDSGGVQANETSYAYSISADGRYVAFYSYATNLVPGDTNGLVDIFVRDRRSGTTERVSVDSAGSQANGQSYYPAISSDGRYVAFSSYATNLVPGDTNGYGDVFVRDRQSATTERVSVDSAGAQGDAESEFPSISADGRYVVFTSDSTNLVHADTNGYSDVFVRDRQNATTQRVSVNTGNVQANGDSDYASISADGRYVAFGSMASNLVSGDTNGVEDVFVRDRQNRTTARVSIASSGLQGDDTSYIPSLSADGRYVTFHSNATNLVPEDTNGFSDIFVRDTIASGFTDLCDPGVLGVISCPCSNSPSGAGRGCDNSAATGGASLAASGIAYLSMDSLVFTTSAEKPTATSIVMQGNSLIAGGLVFGQGVRCVGGTLKRLYTKTAVGGDITAPDFGAGDPTVSARSATLGDVIQAGQSRYYLVYYRDPIVLGGCPASSTFNATQTGQVVWSL